VSDFSALSIAAQAVQRWGWYHWLMQLANNSLMEAENLTRKKAYAVFQYWVYRLDADELSRQMIKAGGTR
jgi:hypothetical protein